MTTVVQRGQQMLLVQLKKKKEWSGWVESSPMGAAGRREIGELFLLLQIHCSNPFPFQHEILYEWVNLVYLDMDSQAQIQEEFEERSEILLKDFLKVSPVLPYSVVTGLLVSSCHAWPPEVPSSLSHSLFLWMDNHCLLVHCCADIHQNP